MITLKNKNSYSCNIYAITINDNLRQNENDACFAGITHYLKHKDFDIYIGDYERKETIVYAVHLINLINKITPCELVTIKNKKYIKFRLLKTYDQNLLLLNFIRNLWHSGDDAGWGEFDVDNCHSIIFFKKLISLRSKDTFTRLTRANKYACIEKKIKYCPGHSNLNCGAKLKIKTTEELVNYTGRSTQEFLTT